MITRRTALKRALGGAAALTALPLLEACAPSAAPATATAPATAAATAAAATLGPPETTSISLTAAPCCSPIFGAEKFLREEGFTDVKISDKALPGEITAGTAQMGQVFPQAFFNMVETGAKAVAVGGVHPGCVELWAQPGIASLKDVKGKTILTTGKTLTNLQYSYIGIVLQQAGISPADVNWVVQADGDPLRAYLDGKSDVVEVATTAAAAIKKNPANKGKMIHSQVMDQPWSSSICCFIVVSEPWYRSNPIAAKRALRAIYRTADALGADRSDAVKAATDKGLFGGAAATANVLEAANMVPLDWRSYDPEKSVRFYAPLLTSIGVLKASADDLVKAMDLKIHKELSTELKK